MRYLLYLFIAALIISWTDQTSQKTVFVDLSGYWKFKTGDSVIWADPDYHDASWDSIRPYLWETQGYGDYDGFAWFRKKIVLPSSMKKQAYHDSIVFDFGKIDDCNQIYLNGKLVETSPNFDSGCSKDCSVYHKLYFHTDQLIWDKEIYLAVRVCDAGGAGGFFNPEMNIRPLQMNTCKEEDKVRIAGASVRDENMDLTKTSEIAFIIVNNTRESIRASLEYFIINSNSDSAKKVNTDLILESGQHEYTITIKPDKPGFYFVTYELSYNAGTASCIRGRIYAGFAEGESESKPFDKKKMPLIYSSDLFHPHGDPDDHFDLISVFSLEDFEIREIILDQGMNQKKDNGIIPVTQLKHIAGINFPVCMGLPLKLKSQEDKALDQPKEYQRGVIDILEILEKSPVPVTFAAVGSLRDIAAAYNRNPGLFRKKAGKLFLFIGDAHDTDTIPYECNVCYDSCAYIRLMNSGLPIYWIPCFDGKYSANTNASVWAATHDKILEFSSPKIINYIAYMMSCSDDPDFMSYIDANRNKKEIDNAMFSYRWFYGVGIFSCFSDMKIVKKGSEYAAVPAGLIHKTDTVVYPFSFVRTAVYADDKAVIHYEKSARSHDVMLFRINDRKMYPKIMTSVTANLYKNIR